MACPTGWSDATHGKGAKPMWVPATVAFGGTTWTKVGVRYKGNSSLRGGRSCGTGKLPLKLDFDQFEDDSPEIADQRFHGFKQLSLANNWGDPTGLRETLMYDLLEEAGLVAAHTAPYEIVLDSGQGRRSLGLYTAIEVIDDTVVLRQVPAVHAGVRLRRVRPGPPPRGHRREPRSRRLRRAEAPGALPARLRRARPPGRDG